MRTGRLILAGAGLTAMMALTSCGDGAKPATDAGRGSEPAKIVDLPASTGRSVAPQHKVVTGSTAVDFVIQAEESLGNNDRASALAFYDKAISLTKSDGNAKQAQVFEKRKAAIIGGGSKR